MDDDRKIEPIKYAERMLVALAEESRKSLGYLAEPGCGLDEWDLGAKAGIISKESAERHRVEFHSGFIHDLPYIAGLMIEEGWVESFKPDKASLRTLFPTAKGLRHAEWLMRPRYQKAWDYLKGDIRTYVFAVIATLVTVGVLQLVGC